MKYFSIRFLVVCVAALLLFSNVAQAQAGKPVPYQEGLHYFLIEGAPAVSGEAMKLEEAFSYLCTHCYTFEPYAASWVQRKPENVTFRDECSSRSPFRPDGTDLERKSDHSQPG